MSLIRWGAGSERHGPALIKSHPAAPDAVDNPDTSAYREYVCKSDTDDCRKRHCRNNQPGQGIPERPYLPAEMGIKISVAYFFTLQIVKDHSDN